MRTLAQQQRFVPRPLATGFGPRNHSLTSAEGTWNLQNLNLVPNSGNRILDVRILGPNFWDEFLAHVFQHGRLPVKNIHSRKIHLPKFTSKSSILKPENQKQRRQTGSRQSTPDRRYRPTESLLRLTNQGKFLENPYRMQYRPQCGRDCRRRLCGHRFRDLEETVPKKTYFRDEKLGPWAIAKRKNLINTSKAQIQN